MLLRQLNEEGISRFRAFLSDLRDGEMSNPPSTILENNDTSTKLDLQINVEQRSFDNKAEVGEYLDTIIPLLPKELQWSQGIWSWLSLFFFEQVCPKKANGTRKVLIEYRYILSREFWHRHRHLLTNPYIVHRLHDNKGKVMLCSPVHIFTDFNEQIPARQDLLDNPGILDAIDILYLDPKGDKTKKGALAKDDRPGVLRRLFPVLNQYDVTYDLQGMTVEEILSMLPQEFDVWKS